MNFRNEQNTEQIRNKNVFLRHSIHHLFLVSAKKEFRKHADEEELDKNVTKDEQVVVVLVINHNFHYMVVMKRKKQLNV